MELLLKGDGMFLMTQKEKINKLETPRTEERFKSQRTPGQYIGVNCRPDICAAVQPIAPGHQAICDAQFKSLRKVVDHLNDTGDVGINFVKLDM